MKIEALRVENSALTADNKALTERLLGNNMQMNIEQIARIDAQIAENRAQIAENRAQIERFDAQIADNRAQISALRAQITPAVTGNFVSPIYFFCFCCCLYLPDRSHFDYSWNS